MKLFFYVLMFGLFIQTAAASMVLGTVFDLETASVIEGAEVKVSCEGQELSVLTNSAGNYKVFYSDAQCPKESMVTVQAVKGDYRGNAAGKMKDMIIINIATIDVFIEEVPEFTAFGAAAAMIGAGIYGFRRRKS